MLDSTGMACLPKRTHGIHALGLTMCVTILIVTVLEKFREGGWLTLTITSGVGV